MKKGFLSSCSVVSAGFYSRTERLLSPALHHALVLFGFFVIYDVIFARHLRVL